MAETAHPQAGRSSPQRQHEPSDVSVRAVAYTGGGIALTVLLVAGLVWLLLALLPPSRPATGIQPGPPPPAPQLQPQPRKEIDALRARQRARLHGYGWIDRERGIVHIPIERAMTLLVERSAARSGDGTRTSSGTGLSVSAGSKNGDPGLSRDGAEGGDRGAQGSGGGR